MSLENQLIKLVSRGLQAKLTGETIIGAVKVEFDLRGGIVGEEDPFIIYQDDETGFWLAALGGPGHSSTILKTSVSINDVTESLIGFLTIKAQSALSSEKIQRLIWNLQRLGLATQIRQDAVIEVFCAELHEVDPYEFMLSNPIHVINHSVKIEIFAQNEFWLLKIFRNSEQTEELLVNVDKSEYIMHMCQIYCN